MAVSGVARLQDGRPAAVFYPLGQWTRHAARLWVKHMERIWENRGGGWNKGVKV
jgi:hypothetical protein